MTEEVKKEVAPSRHELTYFRKLVEGGPSTLVLVLCTFEGKERFAIGKLRTVAGKPYVEPLAVVLHEKDNVQVYSDVGELLPLVARSLGPSN